MFVLPAFETQPNKNMTEAHMLADNAAMMSKEQLKQLVDKNLVYQFALKLFRQVRPHSPAAIHRSGCIAAPGGCAGGSAETGPCRATTAWRIPVGAGTASRIGPAAPHLSLPMQTPHHDSPPNTHLCACRATTAQTTPSGSSGVSPMKLSTMRATSPGSSLTAMTTPFMTAPSAGESGCRVMSHAAGCLVRLCGVMSRASGVVSMLYGVMSHALG